MARIELSFYDKNYVIEFNRASVKGFLKIRDNGNELDQVVALIKSGLIMHHENDMPSDDEIFGWVMAMGEEVKDFAEALQGMVQEVLDAFKEDRKNLKWGKVEA